MTSPPPPMFSIPARSLTNGKAMKNFGVTISENNRVALVPPVDVFVVELTDEAVGQLQEALRETLRSAMRRRQS